MQATIEGALRRFDLNNRVVLRQRADLAAIVAGEYDDMPESAFYMVGTIEEAVEKSRKMAAEAA